MSRLLAPQADAAPLHFRAHVGVADRAAVERDAGPVQRRLEPEVAHDGRHHPAARQAAGRVQMPGRHEEHAVAVHDAPAAVDQNDAVAVAVEGEAQPAPLLDHRRLQRLGMRRAALPVDVAAVRRRVQLEHGDAEPFQHAAGDAAGRAVGAVDGDPLAGHGHPRHDTGQVLDVGIGQIRRFERPPGVVRNRSGRAGPGDARLDAALEVRRGLGPAGLQDLDPVVGMGIVGRGDGDARVEAVARRGDGDPRRRHDADAHRPPAARTHPGGEPPLHPRTRIPGVAAADDARRTAELLGQGGAQQGDGGTVERRGARHAAHSIGAEQDGRHGTAGLGTGRALRSPLPTAGGRTSAR